MVAFVWSHTHTQTHIIIIYVLYAQFIGMGKVLESVVSRKVW